MPSSLLSSSKKDWLYGTNGWLHVSKNRLKYFKKYGKNFEQGFLKCILGTKEYKSGYLGELLAKDILTRYTILENIPIKIQRGGNLVVIKPDFITKNYIIEVKSRTWSISGTAGEKISDVPRKYEGVKELTGKFVIVLLMGYQEEEARDMGYIIEVPLTCTYKKQYVCKEFLRYAKQQGIYYIGATQVLNDDTKSIGNIIKMIDANLT